MQDLAQTDKRWTVHPRMEEMKAAARAQGLWNLWISPSLADCMRDVAAESSAPGLLGAGLSNLVARLAPCMTPLCDALVRQGASEILPVLAWQMGE